MAGVIQGLDLNFNLYLLTLFNGEYSSNTDYILSKSNSIDSLHLVGRIGKH